MGENPNIDDEAVSDAYGEAFADAVEEFCDFVIPDIATRISTYADSRWADEVKAYADNLDDVSVEFIEAALAELKKGEKK